MVGTVTTKTANPAGSRWEAQRIQGMPIDFNATGGHYRMATLSGAIAAGIAGASEILQFRWTHATMLGVILGLRCTGMRATTAFAVGAIDLDCTIARAFTAAGTGGTAQTITTNNAKMRTSMSTTSVGEIRMATTAALGAGTKVLDAQPAGLITTHSSAGPSAATPIIGSIYLPTQDLIDFGIDDGAHPLVLATNEGFVVRCTVPATGVWNIGFQIKWAELAAY